MKLKRKKHPKGISASNNLNLQTIKSLKSKKKLLCWSDGCVVTTGFGVVSKHILKGLYNTGEYEIDQLAINYLGEPYDKKKYPYTLYPARTRKPEDPYGNQMFVDALQHNDYDIVFVINDTYVVEEVARGISHIRDMKAKRGGKPFSLVYYFPVDCSLIPEATTMIKVADVAVPYTNFAKNVASSINIKTSEPIYHGADIKNFYELPREAKRVCRKRYLNIVDDDTFVFITVNRNSPRKDIARTILAFSEFRKNVSKNCVLYIHAKYLDSTGTGMETDLRVPIRELGLVIGKDVLFPREFNPRSGHPIEVLNQLYNCGDVFITNNLGEGWGLNYSNSMACKLPVIAPANTSALEIFGKDRGYLIPCKERIYIDNSGFRHWSQMDDILDQMERAYKDWKDDKTGMSNKRRDMVNRAYAFAKHNSWDNINQKWVQLFHSLKPSHNNLHQLALNGEAL